MGDSIVLVCCGGVGSLSNEARKGLLDFGCEALCGPVMLGEGIAGEPVLGLRKGLLEFGFRTSESGAPAFWSMDNGSVNCKQVVIFERRSGKWEVDLAWTEREE